MKVFADFSGSLWYRSGMFPVRAMRPSSSDPTGMTVPSSRSRTVSGSAFTRGPPACACPFSTAVMPPNPVSDDPITSTMTAFGKRSTYWSLTLWEKIAADDAMDRTEDVS